MVNTTISIPTAMRAKLRTYGFAGDTYADILQKMMDQIDRESFLRRGQELVDRAYAEGTLIDHEDIDWGD